MITNTCLGGVICHELNLRFLTPMVNCGIRESVEFFAFVSHLSYYLSLPLQFDESYNGHPVGILIGEYGTIHLYFTHDYSEVTVRKNWEKRVKRVNYDNVVVIMDGDAYSDSVIYEFDNLPIERKVVLTPKEYPNLHSVFTIKNSQYKQGLLLSKGLAHGQVKWFEIFDYVHFINTGEIRANELFKNH